MKTVHIDIKNIYPDFDAFSLGDLRKFLDGYGIGINFLFDDGLEFTFDPDNVTFKTYPNTGTFYDKNKELILFSLVDDFDGLKLVDKEGSTIFTITYMTGNLNLRKI